VVDLSGGAPSPAAARPRSSLSSARWARASLSRRVGRPRPLPARAPAEGRRRRRLHRLRHRGGAAARGVGGSWIDFVAGARFFVALGLEFFYWVFLAPWKGVRLRVGKAVTELNRIGVDAIPIVALVALLMGVILALNAAGQLRNYGAEKYVANLVGIALTRELAPIITAILVAAARAPRSRPRSRRCR